MLGQKNPGKFFRRFPCFARLIGKCRFLFSFFFSARFMRESECGGIDFRAAAKKKRKIRRDFFSRRQIFCCTSLSLTQMARMKEIFNFFRVYARIDIWETEWTIGNLASMVLERRNIMNPPVSSLAHRRNVSGTNQEEEGVFSSSSSSLFHWQTPTTPIHNGGGGCMYRRREFANECFSNLKFGSFVCFF